MTAAQSLQGLKPGIDAMIFHRPSSASPSIIAWAFGTVIGSSFTLCVAAWIAHAADAKVDWIKAAGMGNLLLAGSFAGLFEAASDAESLAGPLEADVEVE